MDSCADCRDLLLEHLYGLLDEEEARQLQVHLAECATCQHALEGARKDQERLSRAARVVTVIEPFVAPGQVALAGSVQTSPSYEVLTSEPAAQTKPVTQRARSPWRRTWPGWVAAAAVFAAVIVGRHAYQEGRNERSQAVDKARDRVQAIDVQFAAVKD